MKPSYTNDYTKYKSTLLVLLDLTQAHPSFVLNTGATYDNDVLTSFQLGNRKVTSTIDTVPLYTNAQKTTLDRVNLNIFAFSGVLVRSNIHNGRTYLTVKQSIEGKSIELKCVVDAEIQCETHIGQACSLIGHLFPRPLGSYGLTICGCCEVLKIGNKIIYNIL